MEPDPAVAGDERRRLGGVVPDLHLARAAEIDFPQPVVGALEVDPAVRGHERRRRSRIHPDLVLPWQRARGGRDADGRTVGRSVGGTAVDRLDVPGIAPHGDGRGLAVADVADLVALIAEPAVGELRIREHLR